MKPYNNEIEEKALGHKQIEDKSFEKVSNSPITHATCWSLPYFGNITLLL